MTSPKTITITVDGGPQLVADTYGDAGRPGVLFAHGGGQTRHAWGRTASALARRGWYAVSLDLRGHGDSDWAEDGDYRFEAFGADIVDVARGLFARPAVMIGASLGGIAGLLAQDASGGNLFSTLVLVDITPRFNREGVTRVVAFMKAHLEDGFATPDEAADAIASYLPHRRRGSGDAEGLRKNLRLDADGRYRWHWDPRFLADKGPDSKGPIEEKLEEAARRLKIPAMLVRGRMSDVVTEEQAKAFLAMVPHAKYVDVSGAAHMVAGDRNDAFIDAILDFIGEASEAA